MRFFAIGLALAVMIGGAGVMPVQPAQAAGAYCPNPAHGRPAKVPADFVSAVAKAFQTDADAVRDAAFVRCVGARLMACYVGANLNCDKADMRRTLAGATAWCLQHPGATDIPMAATGHDTIYQWSCNGHRAVAGKAVMTVDAQGYVAENWKEVP